MIVRTGVDTRIAAMVAIGIGLMGQPATSVQRAHYTLLSGWTISSSLAAAIKQDLSLSHELVGAHKIMNHEPMLLRMRAFRVIDRRDGNYSKWIVIEAVERALFRTGSHISGSIPPRAMKAEIDKNDEWDVLNSLRNAARLPENAQIHWPVADSIDTAISQEEIRMQGWWEQARQLTPSLVPNEPKSTDQSSRSIVATPGGHASEEELQRMIKEVWDFAGGKRLKWRSARQTPAGRKCEVLTFDGSEIVLVGPTSVEIPSQSK